MQLGFEITHTSLNVPEARSIHSHKEFEFILCQNDGGKLRIGNLILPVQRGSLFIIKGNTPHYFLNEKLASDHFVIHVSYESLWFLSEENINFVTVFENCPSSILLDDEQMQELLHAIEQYENVSNPIGVMLEKNIWASRIILYLVRNCYNTSILGSPAHEKAFMKIMPVLNYIHLHYNEKILLDSICQEMFISKYYLCRQFKEATGFTMVQYISSYRIRQSCIKLQNGATVQQAGEAVGFDNDSNYIRTFKKIMGITPGEYLRQHT